MLITTGNLNLKRVTLKYQFIFQAGIFVERFLDI